MPMSKTGVDDIYWKEPVNDTAALEACEAQWGVRPRRRWANTEWGGRRLNGLTNVVFSNGLFDPWHEGGVMESLSDSVTVRVRLLRMRSNGRPLPDRAAAVQAVIIPDGAHHLDLMFSHEDDPDSVKSAREHEAAAIASWIDEFWARS